MDSEDLKAIGTLLDKKLGEKLDQKLEPITNDLKEIKETQETQTGKILGIERDIKSALELRVDVKEVRDQVKDHEKRLTQLETL